MKKRILSLLLALVMLLGLLPTVALAANETQETPSVTVYFSLTDDDQYVVGDNKGGGSQRVMAYQKFTVPYFDLKLYGLEDYYFSSESYGEEGPSGTSDPYGKITVLHLLIYALERDYCGLPEERCGMGYLKDQDLIGTDVFNVAGNSGSFFMQNIWGHGLNLLYYLNYEYPMASEGWGSTADQQLLHDGDVVSMSLYSDYGFISDETAGFHHLGTEANKTQGAIEANADDTLDLVLYRSSVSMGEGTTQTPVDGLDVYYCKTTDLGDGDVTHWQKYGTANEDGTISIDLKKLDLDAGDYIFSVAGQYSTSTENLIVSCPGGTLVTVKDSSETPTQPSGFLKSLRFKSGALSSSYFYEMQPAFDQTVFDYTIVAPDNSPNCVPVIELDTEKAPADAEIWITYTAVNKRETRTKYTGKNLWNFLGRSSVTGNTMTIEVGSGEQKQTYTITAKRIPTLKTLKLINAENKEYALTPTFSAATFTGYEVYLPYEGATVQTALTAANAGTTVKVNGTAVSGDYPLNAPALWQGEAGSRHFTLTATTENATADTVGAAYTIECKELPSGLMVTSQPTKTEYICGEAFDTTGLAVSVQYHGQAKPIDLKDLTITPARMNKVGDEVAVTLSYLGTSTTVNVSVKEAFTETGTQEDPFILDSAEALQRLSNAVAGGVNYAGKYFKITNDITLPDNWTPIGGPTLNRFSGYIDGAKPDGTGCYTITVPKGSKTMIGALAGGKLSNLNIYGEKIDGYGVMEYYGVDKSNPIKAEFNNVTLKSGTHTKYSGFIGGYASGVDVVLIRNCTVEAGVIIGDDGTFPEWAEELKAPYNYPFGPTGVQRNDMIGSFGGAMSGTIENCVSHAKVYGRKFVGGILGFKGQSMGDCIVRNCVFDGEVHATGSFAGGITGGGYSSTSAPNTPAASVENCVVTGSVTGATCVGGIFGGEELLAQCWNNGIGYVRGNYFNGKVTATAEDGVAGGIIGYMHSLDCYNVISNNYYITGAAAKGIGKVNEAKVDTASGTHYGRNDDPLGKDADKLTTSFESAALTDGTLTGSLNAAVAGYAWTRGASAPALSTAKRVVRLTSTQLNMSGGVRFWQDTGIGNLNGKKVTVTYSDGTTEEIDATKCALSGIDFTKTGYQLGAITYKGYQLFFGVEMVSGGTAPTDTKAVTVSVLGDTVHDVTTDSVHTLAQGNLSPWLTDVTVVVDKDATALEAFDAACDAYGLSYVATDSSYGGKYITSVTSASGVTLTDQSNKQSDGKSYSGWMYTVDGTTPSTAIDKTNVTSSLVVYFEDDYNLAYVQSVIGAIDALPTPATEEAVKAIEDQMQWFSPVARASVTNLAKLTAAREALEAAKAAANVVDLINAIPAEITKDSGTAIKAARDAYNALNDAAKELVPADKLKKLTDAEAKYADLTKPVTPVTPVTPSAPAQLPQNPNAGETLPFTDVNANSWYYSGVKYAYKNGLMNGTGNGTFSPNADTTRGMIVTMLARLEGQNTSGTPWYAAGQKWAMDAGISDGTNMPGAITREQLAAILFRYAKQKGYDVSKSADLNGFADANTVSTYATDAMRWAVASGLIQGSNSKLSPKATASRAQVATILMRFMELYAK